MKLGVSLPNYYDAGNEDPFGKTFALAQAAEEAGFDYISVAHHHFTPNSGTYSAPLAMLAAIAARTKRIRLAVSIFVLPLHHPIAVAEQIATVDQISNGRVIFGAGVGYRPYEAAGYGTDFKTRGKRTDEALKIIRNAWNTGFFEHDGPTFKIPRSTVFPMPVQSPHPPIWIGGTSDAAIRRAAELGDGWVTENTQAMPELAERIALYRDLTEKAGRPAGAVAVPRQARVAATREEVEKEWLPPTIEYNLTYRKAGNFIPDRERVYERIEAGESIGLAEFARNRLIAGLPDDCIAEIKRWETEAGCASLLLILSNLFEGASEARFNDFRQQIEAFGRHVIPWI